MGFTSLMLAVPIFINGMSMFRLYDKCINIDLATVIKPLLLRLPSSLIGRGAEQPNYKESDSSLAVAKPLSDQAWLCFPLKMLLVAQTLPLCTLYSNADMQQGS